MIDNKELKLAIKAAKKAGEVLKENFNKKYRIIRKSPKEMVSAIDIQSQRTILEVLDECKFSYGVITEEKSMDDFVSGYNWIIDPIDGTHNYIAGLPFSGISIGLADNDNFILGVIYFPMEDRLFYALKNEGAFLNDERIFVSKNNDISKSIVCFDNQFHLNDRSFDYYKKLNDIAFTTRILGTATNDICMTSSGNIDGRIFVNTKIVDIAAGIVIATEAKGKITDFDGKNCSISSKQVVVSNGLVHEALLKIVN